MIKQLCDRIKTALGLNKQLGCQIVSQEVSDFMNAIPDEQHNTLNIQHRVVPNGITAGFYDDRLIPGGIGNIGMLGARDDRMQFPLTPEQITFFRDYYYQVFCVEREDFDKFVQEHQHAADVERVVDSIKGAFYGRSKPTEAGGTILPLEGYQRRVNPIDTLPVVDAAYPPGVQTRGDLIDFIEDQLKPKLVYSGPGLKAMGKEPDLIDPTNRRCLQKEWLDWCVVSYSNTMKQAWEVGSKSLIDQEFAHGKMRKNVEILPWDPANPLLVRIKYHDPLDPNDDWFDKEEGNE